MRLAAVTTLDVDAGQALRVDGRLRAGHALRWRSDRRQVTRDVELRGLGRGADRSRHRRRDRALAAGAQRRAAEAEEDPAAPFFNDTTKYVVSGTLTTATWRNSEIIGPYDPDTIRKLKEEVDGDLYVSGSGTLVRAMLADGLVDELNLCVYPVTRGPGPRLFPEDAAPGKVTRAASESYDNGVVYLAYRLQPAA